MNRIVYMHIPKTAGISIRKSLGKRLHHSFKHRGHARKPLAKRLDFLQAQFPEDTLTCFTVLRNPLDRALSAYWYLLKGGEAHSRRDRKDRDIHLIQHEDFNAFVVDGGLLRASKKQVHFRPQVLWLRGYEGGDPPEVHVIRFEELNKGLNDFLVSQGMPKVNLPHRNKSNRGVTSLSSETTQIVREIYEEDYKRWKQ